MAGFISTMMAGEMNWIESSLRAKRSNPEATRKNWIASSPTLLAMTENLTPNKKGDGKFRRPFLFHIRRSSLDQRPLRR
jgi:hypothetical protein